VADRDLVNEIMAGGISDRANAEDMADRVLTAVAARIAAGRSVRIDGVGRLGNRRKIVTVPGAGVLQRIETRVATVISPVEISRGESTIIKRFGS